MHDVLLQPVFNENDQEGTMDMKSWQNIRVIATHKWSVERFESEYRGSKALRLSSLTLSQFEEKEDAYVAAIAQDQNTVNVTSPLINGAKMRSKALKVLLKLDPSVVSESLLQYVEVNSINSPKNK